ncbi:DUF6049 family protein [Leucobacter denitrificans]|uniref:Uncharacterized protein n=1 Tax=Leucobacter denitrificans TaxID=683042 RepID=A0A7G9S2X1_9MICO|nr:DUF6049 family protein [Leucobacter denitrificans]QNN62196.1 hypothetical protein H9L06_07845 [Leucobacter denitrificans]
MRVTRGPGVWAAWLLALALPLTGVLVQANSLAVAHATEESGEIDAAEDAADEAAVTEDVEFVVAPVDPVILATQEEVEFRVLLRNSGKRSLPDGSIELSLGDQIVSGSVILPTGPEVAESDNRPAPVVVATEQIGVTAAASEQEVTVTVPMDEVPFALSTEPGVYRLYAKYVAAESSSQAALTAYSPIVWQGTSDPTANVKVSFIVPLLLPEDVHSMPSRPQLEDAVPGLDDLLDFATQTDAMLAIDPRIIAAVRAYGDEAPESAQEFLARLERSSLTSFTLQYADADPAAQATLNFEGLLMPQGLDFITRFGTWSSQSEAEDEAGSDAEGTEGEGSTSDGTGGTDSDPENPDDPQSDAPATDVSATVDTAADPVTGEPTLSALGDWPGGLPGAWPADGRVSNETMTLLDRSGLDFTVVNSSNVTLTGGPQATLGDGSAAVTDEELTSGVQLALGGATDAERNLGAAQAQARLVLAAMTSEHGLVLGVDRGGIVDSEDPIDVLESLISQDWVQTTAFENQAEGTAVLEPAEPDAERIELLERAAANESAVLETRALLVHPEYLDSYQRMRLLNLFATRNAAATTNVEELERAYFERDEELQSGVSIVGTKKAQLVGVSSRIPVQLRNPLPFDAIVTLSAAPTSAALSMSERQFTDILLPEDSTEGVLVPVRSRVSSGESSILLSVTSTDEEFTSSTDVLPVSISTSLESIAIASLAVAAALLFGFGIWRSVRRRAQSAGE